MFLVTEADPDAILAIFNQEGLAATFAGER
jgi:hypothetical protein